MLFFNISTLIACTSLWIKLMTAFAWRSIVNWNIWKINYKWDWTASKCSVSLHYQKEKFLFLFVCVCVFCMSLTVLLSFCRSKPGTSPKYPRSSEEERGPWERVVRQIMLAPVKSQSNSQNLSVCINPKRADIEVSWQWEYVNQFVYILRIVQARG